MTPPPGHVTMKVDSLKSDEISQAEKKISDLLRCEESRIILSESLLKSSFGVGPSGGGF